MNIYKGCCHCKNIEVELATEQKADKLWVRKCPCDFCTKQGNFNVADPNGKLTVTIHDKNQVFFYQMGHKTSDRLICGTCGVYIGGFMDNDDKPVCVLNVNVMNNRDAFSTPTPIDVSDQTPEERINGRLSRWMPFELRVG